MSKNVLDRLAAALADERQALLERNVQHLLESSEVKRAALQALEAAPPAAADERLRELAEANRMNGILLARRQHEVGVMLNALERHDAPTAYNAQGHAQKVQPQRVLAVA